MARMHSRKRGKSSSKPPMDKGVPDWVTKTPEEIEEIIIQLSKQGNNATAIGLILRDKHAVPSVKRICKKTITQILKEKGVKIDYPDDLMDLMRKAVKMRKHLENNNKDIHNTVKLKHVESKIKRLVKYYTTNKKLPTGWKYNPQTAALLVK